MREFCVSMPGVEDVTDGSVDSFENDWVRETDQDCPTSRCGSRCRCAGCGGRGRCSCGGSSSRCSQSVSRCNRTCANRCSRSCPVSAEAVQAAPVDWEEYEIVDE